MKTCAIPRKCVAQKMWNWSAINFGDLVQYRYNGNQDVTRRELNRLARAGFIRRQIISRTHSEQYTLTRLGRQAVESHRDKESTQTLYHGFVKWREAEHDAAVYKLYQKAGDDIARSGGQVTRVLLDFELKRSLNRQLARTAGMSPEEQARRKQEIAEEHGLKVIDGHVVIPDLRLEYETPDHEQSRVDLEVVTGNYRSGGLSSKARAGFRLYASAADRARLRAAMTDPEIMQEIFSL
jgi:DNA-binding PadR family transcriptional regulator